MANAIKVTNEKAYEIFKQINGPKRRKDSLGSSEVDLKLTTEILEQCGVHLIDFENVSLCQNQRWVLINKFPETK